MPSPVRKAGKHPIDPKLRLLYPSTMLGESEGQFFLTRATLSTCGAQRQIPIIDHRAPQPGFFLLPL